MKLERLLLKEFKTSPGIFKHHKKTKYLSVACSDRDFRAAMSAFHARWEKDGVDRIVEPGGPLVLLEELSARGKKHEIENAKFLIRHHGVKVLILIGHHYCGAYADKYKHKKWQAEQLNEQVKKDLLKLKKRLPKILNIKVFAFFAAANAANKSVKFTPL